MRKQSNQVNPENQRSGPSQHRKVKTPHGKQSRGRRKLVQRPRSLRQVQDPHEPSQDFEFSPGTIADSGSGTVKPPTQDLGSESHCDAVRAMTAEQRANLLMESMWSTGLRIAERRGVFDPEQTVLDAVHTSVGRYDPTHGLKLENFFLMVLYGYINGYWRLQKNQWHAKLVRLELDEQADHV